MPGKSPAASGSSIHTSASPSCPCQGSPSLPDKRGVLSSFRPLLPQRVTGPRPCGVTGRAPRKQRAGASRARAAAPRRAPLPPRSHCAMAAAFGALRSAGTLRSLGSPGLWALCVVPACSGLCGPGLGRAPLPLSAAGGAGRAHWLLRRATPPAHGPMSRRPRPLKGAMARRARAGPGSVLSPRCPRRALALPRRPRRSRSAAPVPGCAPVPRDTHPQERREPRRLLFLSNYY